MKYYKRILSLLLVLLFIVSISCFSTLQTTAVNKFTEGEFEYSIVSEGVIYISAYLGSDTDVILPYEVDGKAVTGIYKDCFKDSAIESVTIPDLYDTIGDLAFYGCNNITSIKMPSLLKSVGTMAFYGCTMLKSVDFSNVRNLSSLSFAMFSGCESLESIVIPDCVTSLDENTFANCSNLSEVTLSKNITVIPEYAFYGCNFSEITLPAGLTTIGNRAFANNNSLASIELPLTLTAIGEGAFENDTALTSLFVSDTVTSIGADAFSPMSFGNTIEVTCVKGSYAEDYCKDNYVKYETVLKGDSNLDGKVDVNDVTNIQLYLVGHEDLIPTNNAKSLSDTYKDGKLTIRDATMIQLLLVGIITEL